MFGWFKNFKKDLKTKAAVPKSEYDWKAMERWEDYPMPDYNAIHTYCKIAFDDSGRTFYYRTRNPFLMVGDIVYVPVGCRYEKKTGKIVSMKNYKGSRAPYPLDRTKYIIGKVE